MTDIDSTKRYDCFVSFHGGQLLNTTGLPSQPNVSTVRDFVERILLQRLSLNDRRRSSVFVDSESLQTRLDDIFDAILQLRGGGVCVVFLTESYFDRKFCRAELTSLMQLSGLVNANGRSEEATSLIFMCLEENTPQESGIDKIKRKVRQMCESGVLDPIARVLADEYTIHSVIRDGTLEMAAQDIATHVWNYWDGVSDSRFRACLGDSQKNSFRDMQRFFVAADRGPMARRLNVRLEREDEIEDILDAALRDRTITYGNVDELLSLCERMRNEDETRAAVTTYQRKWCSGHWSWSVSERNKLKEYLTLGA